MSKEKFTWKGFFQGFQTIFTRNGIIIIILYILNKYSNHMKNAFRSLVAVQSAGVSEAVLGTAVSLFLIVGLLCRAPSGSICDSLRKKLKYFLAGTFALRAVLWCGFIFMKNTPMLYLIFAFDGVLYSFMETAVPAILAISVDKRAMGSAYAVMMGVTNIVTASAKANGVAIYNNSGVGMAVLAAGVLTLIGAVLAIFLDGEKIANANNSFGKAAAEKKFSLKDGLCWKMLPLCIVANMSIVLFTGVDAYFPIYAEGLNFGDGWLAANTLGNTIYGVMNLACGFLCDVMNPAILVTFGLLGQMVAPFIWANATSGAMLNAGILIFFATRFYGTAVRVVGMKAISYAEQGSYQATFMGAFDLFSIVSATVIGFCVTQFGYSAVWGGLGVWQAIALIAYIVMEFTFLKKLRQEKEAPAVQ